MSTPQEWIPSGTDWYVVDAIDPPIEQPPPVQARASEPDDEPYIEPYDDRAYIAAPQISTKERLLLGIAVTAVFASAFFLAYGVSEVNAINDKLAAMSEQVVLLNRMLIDVCVL